VYAILLYFQSSQTLLLDNFAISLVSLYFSHVVHAVAADHNKMRSILIESASLKVAIIRVGHFEAGETPLTAKVIIYSFHETKF
jgi:hypothetical protein